MMWFVGIWIFLLLIVSVHSPLVISMLSIDVMNTSRWARWRNSMAVKWLQYID